MGKVPYETIWLNIKTNLVSEPQTVCLSIVVILSRISIDRSVCVCVLVVLRAVGRWSKFGIGSLTLDRQEFLMNDAKPCRGRRERTKQRKINNKWNVEQTPKYNNNNNKIVKQVDVEPISVYAKCWVNDAPDPLFWWFVATHIHFTRFNSL